MSLYFPMYCQWAYMSECQLAITMLLAFLLPYALCIRVLGRKERLLGSSDFHLSQNDPDGRVTTTCKNKQDGNCIP
ncbi:hypothetical protein BJX99DRAFT_223365 [Aspergillus californicus]